MRITTKSIYSIETGELLYSEGYDYFGPVAECKKGRIRKRQEQERTRRIAEGMEADTALARERQTTQYNLGENIASEFQGLDPTGMTKYSAAQYGGDLENIVRTYRNLRESGQRALTQRGLGRSPSGLVSARNSLDRGQARSENEAYRGALGRSEQQQWNLLGYRQNQQRAYDPTGRGQATLGASQQRFGMDMPSVMDTVAPLLSLGANFIPFAKGLGGLKKGKASTSSTSGGTGGMGGWG